MRILVFTTDVLPLPGLPTSGTALRTHGIVEGLRSHGHEVVISVPRTALAGLQANTDLSKLPEGTQTQIANHSKLAFDPYNQSQILNQVRPEVIICGHWPAMSLRVKPSQLLIIDLAGPHILERHYQGSGEHEAASGAKLAVIATADYFIVSGPSQRLYFLSYLLRAGVDSPEKRCLTITMPLAPHTLKSATDITLSSDYPKFIFGGIFLPWQDPTWSLGLLASEIAKRNQGSLTLIGGEHPNYKIKKGVYENLFNQLSTNSRVKVCPLLPVDEFELAMKEADVAINLMSWNLERQLAVTIRSTSYLWAGLPLIYDDYGDIGSLIRKYDAGWCVHPEDNASFIGVLSEIYSNPDIVRQKSLNALTLSREEFSWDKAVLPIINLLGEASQRRLTETDIIVDTPENADLRLDSSSPIEQVFISRVNGLSRVEFRVATHARRVRQNISYRFFELSAPANGLRPANARELARREIASGSAQVTMLNNNDWMALDFAPLTDSAGRSYLLEITTSEDSGEVLSTWAARSNPYPMVALYHGKTLLEHSCLCLKTTGARL